MNAADKAIAILRAGLRGPSIRQCVREQLENSAQRGTDPTVHPNFTDFERHLNDLPFPAETGPSLTFPDRKRARAGRYWGTWLRSNNRPRFDAEFAIWRKTQ